MARRRATDEQCRHLLSSQELGQSIPKRLIFAHKWTTHFPMRNVIDQNAINHISGGLCLFKFLFQCLKDRARLYEAAVNSDNRYLVNALAGLLPRAVRVNEPRSKKLF